MQTRNVTYSADGANMIGFFAIDESRSGTRPGVLVAPEAPGLDDLTRERCKRLAALGYAALGVDYHGNGEILQDRDTMFARLGRFFADPLPLRARANAALAALIAQPDVDKNRLAAIGYCFGGTVALEIARGGADIKAAVGFHAGLKTARPQDAANIRAKVLILNGEDDPVVPREERTAFEQEMSAGNVDWQLHLYGGVGHAFTRPGVENAGMGPGFAYSESADRRSWQAMLNFFDETLGAIN